MSATDLASLIGLFAAGFAAGFTVGFWRAVRG